MKKNKLLYYLLTFIYVIVHIIAISALLIFWRKQYIVWMTMVKDNGIIGVIAVTIFALFIFFIIMLLFACLSDKFSSFIDKFK